MMFVQGSCPALSSDKDSGEQQGNLTDGLKMASPKLYSLDASLLDHFDWFLPGKKCSVD